MDAFHRIQRLCCLGTTTDPLVQSSVDEKDANFLTTEKSYIELNSNSSSSSPRGRQLRVASLTAGFQNFASSSKALHLFCAHVVICYSTTMILFSFVVEDWSLVDSMYFATVLFLTIGYGDLVPSSNAGRICTMLLSLYGIIVFGLFLGIYAKMLVDSEMKQSARQEARIATVVEEIMIHESSSSSSPKPVAVEKRKELQQTEKEEEEEEEEETKQDPNLLVQDAWQVILLVLPMLSLLLIFGLVLGYLEGWDVLKSLYWCVMTGTTVGFGDESPNTPGVRLACVFFMPLAVAVLGQFLSRVAAAKMNRENRRAEKEYLSRTFTLCDLQTMDTDRNGKVDRAEFLSYILVALQRVSKEDVDQITSLFHKLDRAKDGYLSKEDLQNIHLDDQFRHSVRRLSPLSFKTIQSIQSSLSEL